MIDPKEDRRLETALSEVIAMCAAGTGAPRAAQRTLVSNARRGGPMMIRVAPLGQRNAVANPLAVITVHPSAPTTRANSMRQTFLLTPAELRLLAVMSADATQAQLAVRLGRSVNTVKTQLSSIYEKTGTRTRAELLLMLASRAG
jgi:DNA-binding CsgD family transcriptional regulator